MDFNWKFAAKAGILVPISLIFIYGGYTMDKGSKMSTQWISVPGIILSTDVQKHITPTGRGGETTSYSPGVIYEYKTAHGVFTSSKITYSSDGSKNYKSMAEKVAAKYKKDTRVTVYFNPEYPDQSCLEPGKTRDGIALIIFGALGLLAFALVVSARALDRYAGMGDFAPEKNQREKKHQKDISSS